MSIFFGELQQYVSDIIGAGPKFLGQRHVRTFWEAVAAALDGHVESTYQGMLMTQPLYCDPSALPVLSKDRGIKLYSSEPIASQRYRLSQWWQLHRQRGTHQGEMRNLQPYFLDGDLPAMRIVHQAGDGSSATWHTLLADGTYQRYRATPSNWNWDDQPELWSRWWAIVYTTGTVLETGETTWDDGSTWNGGQYWDGAGAAVFADIIAMLVDWKAAHSRCAGVALARDRESFDPTATAVTLADGRTTLPTGNWNRLTDPATGLPTRLQTASWILDRYRE